MSRRAYVLAAAAVAISLGPFAGAASALNPGKVLRKAVEAPGKIAGEVVERGVNGAFGGMHGALRGIGGRPHHHGHWDVWYYGFNGQYWGWHVYRKDCHTEFEAVQARNYLWSIGITSAYYVYHH
jgi:hypothetical protein